MRRTLFLIRKELIELRRDPRLLGLVILAPILQLTVLGYAATTDVWNVPVVVADGDRSPASRDLIAQFDGSPYFSIVDVVTSNAQIDPYLESGLAPGWPCRFPRATASSCTRRPARPCRWSPTAATPARPPWR